MPTYAPGSYAATSVPTPADRHLASRFSFGVTPALAKAVSGRRLEWFDQQLTPSKVTDASADQMARWWPDLQRTPLDLWLRSRKNIRSSGEVMGDYQAWVLARRLRSNRQVHEVMTAFWENLLHVPVSGDGYFTWRADYGRTIRRYALTSFEQLIAATTLHPAMLTYLNAATSTKDAPNENLGRELLELHTVGVGNYTEDDVKNSARILTGWRVDVFDTWQKLYVPEYHDTDPVVVGTFRATNSDPDGRALTTRYLRYLAHHPDTARHLATRLATVFVSDTPPTSLVDKLTTTYLANKTAIAPVLRVLVRSKAFAAAVDAKLRDPSEDVVASYRALGVGVQMPVDSSSATAVMVAQTSNLGLRFGTWPRPDGAPVTADPWASPLRALASLDLHWNLANRGYPRNQVDYADPASWVPTYPITVADLVDHLARRLLARRSTATMLEVCCTALGVAPDLVISNASSPVVASMPRLLAALLDSPEHYTR